MESVSESDNEGHEPPTPTTPKKRKIIKVKKVAQKYKREWENDFPWVQENNSDIYSAKCTTCGVSFKISSGGIGQIKQHLATKTHSDKTNLKRTSGVLNKFLSSSSSTSSSSNTNTSDIISAAELALTYHAVKHNLSYNSMDCMIKLNKIIYVDSSTATKIHLARTKMEALVTEVLGPYTLKKVIEDLRDKDQFFSLQTDASNKKNRKMFPLVVQYFTASSGVQNKLIDFYENSDESADGMFNAIKQSLESNNLNFEHICGLSADNTNANFGVRHSLFTNLKEVVPNLLKGNCHAHIVHNCVKNAMTFLSYDIENVILKIYSHFSHSAVRRENLKNFIESADGEFRELKRHVGTRWLSLLPCIDTILINWKALRGYFTDLGENCPMIIQNLLLLHTDKDFIEIYLNFSSHILNVFNKTIKSLEGNAVTILDVYSLMTDLKRNLTQRQNDKFYGFVTMKKIDNIEQSFPGEGIKENILKNFTLFIDKAINYLEQWFDFDTNNWLSIISKFNLSTPLIFNDIVNIANTLNITEQMDMDALYNEINLVNDVREVMIADIQGLSTADKWKSIFSKEQESFKNIFKIISMLLSVPASSAFTERVFSVMNAKWRDDRNKATLKLIKNELLIYFNLTAPCLDAVNIFKNDKFLISNTKSSKKYVNK